MNRIMWHRPHEALSMTRITIGIAVIGVLLGVVHFATRSRETPDEARNAVPAPIAREAEPGRHTAPAGRPAPLASIGSGPAAAVGAPTARATPEEAIAANFERVRAQIRAGDRTLAMQAFKALGNCRGRPSDEEYRRAKSVYASRGAGGDEERRLDELYRRCRVFTNRQLESIDELVMDGAELGDDAMRVAYYSLEPKPLQAHDPTYRERLRDFSERAMRYLELSAANGSRNAHLALADAYTSGRIVRRDSALAYVYRVVAGEQQRLHLGPAHPDVRRTQTALERYYSQLSLEDQRRASSLLNQPKG